MNRLVTIASALLLLLSAVYAAKKKCITECQRDRVPVCGSDGVTYHNQCLLDVATCKNSTIQTLHDGKCKK